MSYSLYINNIEIELYDNDEIIPLTKQVNDIASLSNRQTNFTKSFKVPKTAKNVRTFKNLSIVGNNSNIPYQKNTAVYIDNDNGQHLIYKGWAVINSSDDDNYNLNIYDGIIDFYRAIENKSLTDCDVSGLNHAKSLTNIIASWNNTLPYIYAIADYNGKNTFTNATGQLIEINTDYQVPSARVSYIWDRIFAFAGFTYSGTYFETPDFKNFFMTFPKPVPALTPLTSDELFDNIISLQLNQIGTYDIVFFPTVQTNSYFDIVQFQAVNNGTFNVKILQTGAYVLKAANFNIVDGLNFKFKKLMINGFIFDFSINNNIVFTANANSVISMFLLDANDLPIILGTSFNSVYGEISISKFNGYDANFEEAFVDFKATDFVNEIMQRAGLTAFKDKYTNNIKFLSLKEILQSNYNIDWSSKFVSKASEKYRIGKYAKKNNFKYRYNSENETHNDGYITVNDDNLIDETNIIKSKIYSPENISQLLNGRRSKVFKIWDKNLKENGIIDYKDLSGRFYFLRIDLISTNIIIGSETLLQEQAITEMAVANFNGLSFKEILIDNYSVIESILNKSKLIEAYFWLNFIDIENFDFKRLIYVEQLSSYFLVNKIVSFVKNKKTKLELIEVDYLQETIITPPNTATYITIDSFTVVGCVVTVTYSTDATLNTPIRITCALPNFGLPVFTPPDPNYGYEGVVNNTAVQNDLSFTLNAGSVYRMRMIIENVASQNIYSNEVSFENSGTCLLYSPTVLVITAVTLINSYTETLFNTIVNVYRTDFNTDASLPRDIFYAIYAQYIMGIDWGGYVTINATNNSITIEVGTFLQTSTKVRLRIGNLVSNEFNLP